MLMNYVQFEIVNSFGRNREFIGQEFEKGRVMVFLCARCNFWYLPGLVLSIIVNLGRVIQLRFNHPEDGNEFRLLVELEIIINASVHCLVINQKLQKLNKNLR